MEPEPPREPSVKLDKRVASVMLRGWLSAGVAQLVERNLAKVEVASSRLVSRSNSLKSGSSLARRIWNQRHFQ